MPIPAIILQSTFKGNNPMDEYKGLKAELEARICRNKDLMDRAVVQQDKELFLRLAADTRAFEVAIPPLDEMIEYCMNWKG